MGTKRDGFFGGDKTDERHTVFVHVFLWSVEVKSKPNMVA